MEPQTVLKPWKFWERLWIKLLTKRADLGMILIALGARWCYVGNMDVQRSDDGKNMVIILSNLPIKAIFSEEGEPAGHKIDLEHSSWKGPVQ